MGFRPGLLQQRQPRLVLIATRCEVEGSGPGLVHFSIFLFTISSDDVVPNGAFFLAFVIVWSSQIELIIYYTLLPLAVSVEDKAVDSHDFVSGNAHFVNQAFHVPQATEGSHQVAVAISTLSHITRRRPIDVELRLLEDVGNSLDPFRRSSLQLSRQPIETVSSLGFQVPLDVEVRVSVLLIDSSTLPDSPLHITFAFRPGFFVRFGRSLLHSTFWSLRSFLASKWIVR